MKLNSGQATGMLLKEWGTILPDSEGSIPGFVGLLEKNMNVNKKIIRAQIITGNSLESRKRMCRNLTSEIQKRVYLPEYFIFDLLIEVEEVITSLSAIQVARHTEDNNIDAHQVFYADDKKICDDKGWDNAREIFAAVLLEETWNKITGYTKPSYGIFIDGIFHFSEYNTQVGYFLKERLPVNIDEKDWGRVEKILKKEGLSPEKILIETKKAEERFNSLNLLAEDWLAMVEKKEKSSLYTD